LLPTFAHRGSVGFTNRRSYGDAEFFTSPAPELEAYLRARAVSPFGFSGVGDEGSLGGCSDEPVVPDSGGEGEQSACVHDHLGRRYRSHPASVAAASGRGNYEGNAAQVLALDDRSQAGIDYASTPRGFCRHPAQLLKRLLGHDRATPASIAVSRFDGCPLSNESQASPSSTSVSATNNSTSRTLSPM
jgi:hypothetical protein